MSWEIVLFVEAILLFLQAAFAEGDGYLKYSDLKRRGIVNAYSLMEHGGYWADIFIISPVVAYITGRYELAYTSWYSIATFVVACAVIGGAGYGYGKHGEKKKPDVMLPDSYVHEQKTSLAGWVHLIFAVAVCYVIVMFYLTPITPAASRWDMLIISSLLTPFCFLGVCKFTRRWKFSPFAMKQVAIQLVGLWLVTAWRLPAH
jgi:hypothetical protein